MENKSVFGLMADLKKQFLIRLLCLMAGYMLLFVAFANGKILAGFVGFILCGLPEIIFSVIPDQTASLFDTLYILDKAGIESRLKKNAADEFLSRDDGVMSTVRVVYSLFLGPVISVYHTVRCVMDYLSLEKGYDSVHPRTFALKLFQGIAIPAAIGILWLYVGGVIGSQIGISYSRSDYKSMYSISDNMTAEEKTKLLQDISDIMRGVDYFYYVDCPFTAEGLTLAEENPKKSDGAEYQICISHTNNGNEIYELDLTLSEDGRSGSWARKEEEIVHPVEYNGGAAIYYSIGKSATTVYYMKDGTYVKQKLDEAPEVYRDLFSYALLTDEQLTMIEEKKDTTLKGENRDGIIKLCCSEDGLFFGVAVKDEVYPYNVYFSSDEICYETSAIRFNGVHSISLPE